MTAAAITVTMRIVLFISGLLPVVHSGDGLFRCEQVSVLPAPPDDPMPVPDRRQPPPIDAEALARQSGDVAQRLRDRIPAALFPYFDEFLYVSKAASGPLAFSSLKPSCS